jgi:hypothetical protein
MTHGAMKICSSGLTESPSTTCWLLNDSRSNWNSERGTTRSHQNINHFRRHQHYQAALQLAIQQKGELIFCWGACGLRARRLVGGGKEVPRPFNLYKSQPQTINLRVSRSIHRSITNWNTSISTLIVGAGGKTLLSSARRTPRPMRMTQQPATHRRPHTITDKHMSHCHMCNSYTMEVINIPGC